MLTRSSDMLPTLVSVTTWGALDVPTTWLANARLAGDRLTAEVPVPVPVRLTNCGLLLASSVNFMLDCRVPVPVGVNITLIAQFAPADNTLGQVFVWP